MNPNDYDEDGNNIVPCPLCLDVYCPSKENGKCPDEDEYARDMTTPHTCCDGECNHDDCCGKVQENCPMNEHTPVESNIIGYNCEVCHGAKIQVRVSLFSHECEGFARPVFAGTSEETTQHTPESEVERYVKEFDTRFAPFKIGRIYGTGSGYGKLPVIRESFTSTDLSHWLRTNLNRISTEAYERGKAEEATRRDGIEKAIEQGRNNK